MVAVQCAVVQMKKNSPGFTYVFWGLEEGGLGHVAVTGGSDQKARKMLRCRKAMNSRTRSLQKLLVCLQLETVALVPAALTGCFRSARGRGKGSEGGQEGGCVSAEGVME